MTKSRVISQLISIVIANAFLFFIFRKPNGFHLLPYLIHQGLFSNVIDESIFIDIFDILCSSSLFFLSVRIIEGITYKKK